MKWILVLLVGCGSGGGVPGIDAAPPAQVTLKNLTATLDGDNVQCATNGSTATTQCPEYTFRFVLKNESTSNIAIVDHLRLAFGSEELYNEIGGICTVAPWAVPAGGESPLILIQFSYTRHSATDGEFKPRFYFECGGGSTRSYAPGKYKYGDAMPSLPTAGVVTLKVQGILADGAPFLASAPTALSP